MHAFGCRWADTRAAFVISRRKGRADYAAGLWSEAKGGRYGELPANHVVDLDAGQERCILKPASWSQD